MAVLVASMESLFTPLVSGAGEQFRYPYNNVAAHSHHHVVTVRALSVSGCGVGLRVIDCLSLGSLRSVVVPSSFVFFQLCTTLCDIVQFYSPAERT